MAEISTGDAAIGELYRAFIQAHSPGEHLDETMWQRLAHDDLRGPDRDRAFDHVTSCGTCTRVWQGILTLQGEAAAQRLIARGPAAILSWPRIPIVRTAMAATLAVAIGGVMWLRMPTRSTAPEPAPGSPTVSAPAPSASAAWLSAFPLSKAAVHITLDEAMAVRSAPAASSAGPTLDELAAALEPYRRDDFAGAVARLDPLWRAFPTAGRPGLYLGVSLLHLDRAADAIEPLRSATSSTQPEVSADARWYLAVALAQTSQPGPARAEVSALCDAGGEQAARACAALKALDQARP